MSQTISQQINQPLETKNSGFTEQVIYEFPPIFRRKTWTKDIKYRIRIVRRLDLDKRAKIFLDIRENITTEQYGVLTERGFYFYVFELKELKDVITKAIKIIQKEEKPKLIKKEKHARTRNRNRKSNSVCTKKKKKLL